MSKINPSVTRKRLVIKLTVLVLALVTIFAIIFIVHNNHKEQMVFKQYNNGYYTLEYPADWLKPVTRQGNDTVVFQNVDKDLNLYVSKSRIYGDYENYLEDFIDKSDKDLNIEDCKFGDIKGYKAIQEEDNEMFISYMAQVKDIVFDISFGFESSQYKEHKDIMNQIISRLEINDFASLEELNATNEYTFSTRVDGDRGAGWLADIEFISKRLPASHKNLFFQLGQDDFSKNIEEIKAKLPNLTEDELFVEASRLVASVGDAHTRFEFNSDTEYPVKFYYFTDGIYLINTLTDYNEFIGQKLVAINGVAINEVIDLFRPIISHENDYLFRSLVAEKMIIPQYLKGLHITEADTVEFKFSDEEGNEKTVLVEQMGMKVKNLPSNNQSMREMMYIKNSNQKYWFEYLEDEELLYFKYNSCSNMPNKLFSEFNEELFAFIDSKPVKKLVVDLRNNRGGSSPILDPFFEELSKRQELNQPDKLFVVIGRETFSSAILNAYSFKDGTNATLIGEPTGAIPNHYGEVNRLNLVNMNAKISYSTKYFKRTNEDFDSLVPNIVVEQSSKEYFNNIDPVIKWIIDRE